MPVLKALGKLLQSPAGGEAGDESAAAGPKVKALGLVEPTLAAVKAAVSDSAQLVQNRPVVCLNDIEYSEKKHLLSVYYRTGDVLVLLHRTRVQTPTNQQVPLSLGYQL